MPRPKRKAVDDTMQAAKRARGETDLKWDLKWSEAGPNLSNGPRPLLVLDSDTLPGVSKVAGFDIDWTVIRTASGRKFATGRHGDQRLFYIHSFLQIPPEGSLMDRL